MIPLTRLDYYLDSAENWSSFLKAESIPLTSETVICDLLPGWAPKIPIALELLGFNGSYIAVDENQQHLDILAFFLRATCAFTYATKKSNIFTQSLPPASVYLMNHGVDDLLLHQQGSTSFESELDLHRKWQTIERKKDENIPNTVEKLMKLIMSLDKKASLLILQYPSYHDLLNQFNLPYNLSKKCLHELHQQLLKKNLASKLTLLPAGMYNTAGTDEAISLSINL